MSIEKKKTQYEFLVRWDDNGNLSLYDAIGAALYGFTQVTTRPKA